MSESWEETGGSLVREFRFSTYMDGALFAQSVAQKADEAGHHPEITIGYKKVRVVSTTHDAGNTVTEKDRALARSVDEVFGKAGGAV